jgi:hypothetical protein
MVTDFKGLSIRISVRSDVWAVINKSDEALDKCEQYMADIVWRQNDFDKMLALRIHSYLNRKNLYGMYGVALRNKDAISNPKIVIRELFAPIFEWAGESYSPSEFIYLFSDGKPRWAIDLCKRALKKHREDKKIQICIDHFYEAMDDHGKARLKDLYKEHSQEFKQIEKLIHIFSGGAAYYKTESLLFILDDKFGNKNKKNGIDRVKEKIDCLNNANFLYKIGFIHTTKFGNYNLKNTIQYEDKPDLLIDIYNLDFNYHWMINIIYQKALNITRRLAEVPPNDWVEKFFHPPYREIFMILEKDEKIIQIGKSSLIIKVLEVRLKKAKISLREIKSKMKSLSIINPKNIVGVRIPSTKKIKAEEERIHGPYEMEEEKIQPIKIMGIIYFIKILKITNNPNMIQMKLYNEIAAAPET